MTFRQKYLYGDGPIEINAGRRTVTLTVRNTGDRAIQVGSHYHFFEVNSALAFDRQQALGMHLNIPAGTAVRIEPGGSREVELCTYAGTGRLVGFSGLLNGSLVSHPAKVEAVRRAIERGFQGADGESGTQGGADPADSGTTTARSKAKPKSKPASPSASSTPPSSSSSSSSKEKGSR